jgi:hypothetical protein
MLAILGWHPDPEHPRRAKSAAATVTTPYHQQALA